MSKTFKGETKSAVCITIVTTTLQTQKRSNIAIKRYMTLIIFKKEV